MQCSIDGCPQLVLSIHEQKRKSPLCFYHAKVRDGLIDAEDSLSPADKKWKHRDAIARKYKGYPYKIAHKIMKTYGKRGDFELQDLISVGIIALYEAACSENAVSSYVYSRIQGAVKNYVTKNSKKGITGVDHRVFWDIIINRHQLKRQKSFDDQEFMSHTVDSLDRRLTEDTSFHDFIPDIIGQSPEQLMQRKENEKDIKALTKQVVQFYNTLKPKEQIVFQRRILAKEPMDLRGLAKHMGYKSDNTIRRLETKIINKAKDYFFEPVNCRWATYTDQLCNRNKFKRRTIC